MFQQCGFFDKVADKGRLESGQRSLSFRRRGRWRRSGCASGHSIFGSFWGVRGGVPEAGLEV